MDECIDLSVDSINNVKFIKGDFTEDDTKKQVTKLLDNKKADIILSDMAPAASGDKQLDHARLINLSEEALGFCIQYLKKGGFFVTKCSHGIYGL